MSDYKTCEGEIKKKSSKYVLINELNVGINENKVVLLIIIYTAR